MRRVVITGRGCISGAGLTVGAFDAAMRDGRSAIAPYRSEDGPLAMKAGAPVTGYVPEDHFDGRRLRQLDLVSQFALLAGREAMTESGLVIDAAAAGRAGCIFGTGMGGQGTIDDVTRRLYGAQAQAVPPMAVPRAMVSAAASQISMEFGLKGPTFAVSSACASATHAIGVAFQMVRSGALDVALSGGTEKSFVYGHLKTWDALRVVAPDTCRPFSRDRKGIVLGEGAGVIVLEEAGSALGRGAPILAEVVGFGQSADAGDLLQPSDEGMAAAMAAALADGRLRAPEVAYINAHGTGTAINDRTEARAIRQVFGEHASRLMVSSTKSLHGHALGAAGALELLAVLVALREGVVPPTGNFTEPDPECDLDVVPNRPRRADVRVALSNSFGFGGLNAVLAVRRWEP